MKRIPPCSLSVIVILAPWLALAAVPAHAQYTLVNPLSPRAVAWNLATRTTADLHSWLGTRYILSQASSIAHEQVVGVGFAKGLGKGSSTNAILWNLSNQTVLDLHAKYLKAAGFRDSYATAIDADGVIIGYGFRNTVHDYRAEAWALVPKVRLPREPEPPTTVGHWVTPLSDYILPTGIVLTGIVTIALLIGATLRRARSHIRPEPTEP